MSLLRKVGFGQFHLFIWALKPTFLIKRELFGVSSKNTGVRIQNTEDSDP